MFIATSTSLEIPVTREIAEVLPPPPPSPQPKVTASRKSKEADLLTHCTVCSTPGTNQNLVMYEK